MLSNSAPESLRINAKRFKSDFEALSQIGSTGDGGVHRPSLSLAHLAARDWLRERIAAASLEWRQDDAGNQSAFLSCGPENGKTLLLGSHLDSVPYGGRFDGALGVLAALETLRVVKETGLTLPFNLEAIDFTDEEGTLVGLLGSRALAGKLDPGELQNPRGGRQALLEGFERSGLTEAGLLQARRNPEALAGYLELHIEQGPRLTQAGAEIGIVSAIVGIVSYRLAFIGRADHAGTTPMADRLDAAQGASAFTLATRRIVMHDFPGCVANVGDMRFSPGAFNIVPAHVDLSLEFRASRVETLERLETSLLSQAQEIALENRLELGVEILGRHTPAPMSARVQKAIAQGCDRLGLKSMTLHSGAGHDAQSLADLCPTGMIFIPSAGGASHSPREFSAWHDCLNGANALLQATLLLQG